MVLSAVKKAFFSEDVGEVTTLFFLLGCVTGEASADKCFGHEKSMSMIRAGSCCKQIQNIYMLYMDHYHRLEHGKALPS